MIGQFFDKKYLFFILIIGVGILVLISLLSFHGDSTLQQEPQTNSTSGRTIQRPFSDITLEGIPGTQPSRLEFLEINRTHTFGINLIKTYKLSQLKISLKKKDLARNAPPTEVAIENEIAGTNLIVITKELIQPYTDYELSVTASLDNRIIFQRTYLTGPVTPSPIPYNNLALTSYLPYETDNYLLTYLQDRNTYIFNFKGDLNSSTAIEIQFDQAKQSAIEFIENKGIDISSIAIEWKFR